MGGQVSRSGQALAGFVFVLPRAAMERHEIDLVLDRRSRFRASWQACAEMVDRSVHDVRMACDPAYASENKPRVIAATPVSTLKDLTPIEARVLDMLGQFSAWARGGQRQSFSATVTELAHALGMGVKAASAALVAMEQRGLTDWRGRPDIRQWRLTPTGHTLVGAVH